MKIEISLDVLMDISTQLSSYKIFLTEKRDELPPIFTDTFQNRIDEVDFSIRTIDESIRKGI